MMNFVSLAVRALVGAALITGAAMPSASAAASTSIGKASWYGPGFHGRQTANGERYNMNGMTAAHKSFKFGTKVKVTNTSNGKSVVVRINDRGPYSGGRVIDLSKKAATVIGMVKRGVAPVKIEVVR